MRGILQRAARAKVTVDSEVTGEIGKGILLLVGIGPNDGDEEINYILDKTINLRIFEDEAGKMNLSVNDIDGGLLIVPNFTLYGDARKGRRPGYSSGASPAAAAAVYDRFVAKAKESYAHVQTGVFQEEMLVELVNDGPVTIMLDSDRLF